MTSAPTQVVLLTPAGRGAVASLLVAGPSASEWVGQMFHRARVVPLDQEPCGKVLYGRWQSADAGEEVIVCRRDDCQVEIHCHGGEAAARAIIASLVERGCQLVDWRAWVRQTTADPIAAAARIALADAPTDRTAAILCDQYAGALHHALDAVGVAIADGDLRDARQHVESLLDHARVGLHLIHPWRVVLAGRPNVGKSSLINALVGYTRAIVHPTPGTTRDIVTADTAIDGWPVELADTAGLHTSADPIESAGIRLTHDRLGRADLVVLVFDASSVWSPDDDALAAAWPHALVVHNKCDLAGRASNTDRPQGLATSALSGEGVDRLAATVAERLVPRSPGAGQAVPFTPGHVHALEQIREALAAGRLDVARRLLAKLGMQDFPTC